MLNSGVCAGPPLSIIKTSHQQQHCITVDATVEPHSSSLCVRRLNSLRRLISPAGLSSIIHKFLFLSLFSFSFFVLR